MVSEERAPRAQPPTSPIRLDAEVHERLQQDDTSGEIIYTSVADGEVRTKEGYADFYCHGDTEVRNYVQLD